MMKRATMATFSPKHSSTSYDVRSISLPTRSHPTTTRIEEELNKLKSWEASSSSSSSSKLKTICSGLCGLIELYKCVEDLLKLPLTQQALSQHQHEKWIDELLDCPVRFLDILGNTRDAISSIKAGVRDFQSAIRRRKLGDLSMETHVSAYWGLRRNMRKESTKSLLLLKQIDGSFGASPPLDLNSHLSAVVRVLREANFITCFIFHSLLVFLSAPILKSKPNKWAFVSKLMQKGVLVSNNQEDNLNQLEKVDFALNSLMMNNPSQHVEASEKIQHANGRLEDLVEGIEGLESGLECLFKHLINNRVSFLNIVSP